MRDVVEAIATKRHRPTAFNQPRRNVGTADKAPADDAPVSVDVPLLADRCALADPIGQGQRRGLAAAPRLSRVAETHAKWMARATTVSHNSTVAGQSTVKARIIASGIPIRAGSENIGMVHRFQIDGSSFRIRNSGACDFATASGQQIAPHSYTSLARHMVGLGMGSAGHRRNILDPKVSMVATGAPRDHAAQRAASGRLRERFHAHQQRLTARTDKRRDGKTTSPVTDAAARKRATLDRAMARARARLDKIAG